MLHTLLARQQVVPLYLAGADHPTSQTTTLRALLALAAQVVPMLGAGPNRDANAKLARQHLADNWGLYLLGGKQGGSLLWATGTRGTARQEYLAKHHTGYKWGKGADAVARLVDLGLEYTKSHRVPKHLYPNDQGTIPGVPIPLGLLDDPEDAAGAQVPSDAPCDWPPPGVF